MMHLLAQASPGAQRHFFLADHNTFYNHQLTASEASDLPAGRQASGAAKTAGASQLPAAVSSLPTALKLCNKKGHGGSMNVIVPGIGPPATVTLVKENHHDLVTF